jgi:hypothetical protein
MIAQRHDWRQQQQQWRREMLYAAIASVCGTLVFTAIVIAGLTSLGVYHADNGWLDVGTSSICIFASAANVVLAIVTVVYLLRVDQVKQEVRERFLISCRVIPCILGCYAVLFILIAAIA